MSLPFQRPPKMPSMIPPRFLHLRGSQQGMVWLTKMVSSPMTSISFHPITISSSWPISPMHLGRPWMTMATSWAVQVSTSTSSTQPRRVPVADVDDLFAMHVRNPAEHTRSSFGFVLQHMRRTGRSCFFDGGLLPIRGGCCMMGRKTDFFWRPL